MQEQVRLRAPTLTVNESFFHSFPSTQTFTAKTKDRQYSHVDCAKTQFDSFCSSDIRVFTSVTFNLGLAAPLSATASLSSSSPVASRTTRRAGGTRSPSCTARPSPCWRWTTPSWTSWHCARLRTTTVRVDTHTHTYTHSCDAVPLLKSLCVCYRGPGAVRGGGAAGEGLHRGGSDAGQVRNNVSGVKNSRCHSEWGREAEERRCSV